MNNYFNYQNQDMINNYKQKLNTENVNDLYDPYQGFIKGNLYKDLYDPYKIRQPYEIKPMNEQAEMLTYIDALSFACIDLNLYLDVFPNNQQLIDLYNQYNMQKKELMEQYQTKFGPIILSSSSLNSYPWAWDDKPWPWENS